MIGALMDLLAGFYVKGKYSRVEAIARSLLVAVPDDRVSLQFLGLAYYRSGRIDQAKRVFERVVNRRKKSALRMPWHSHRQSAGDAAAAATVCYMEATRPSSELAKTWFDLGLALNELGAPEKAISAFDAALAAQPDFAEAMLAMGSAALRAGDLDAAAEGFNRLRALNPEARDAYQGLGQVYRQRRDFAAARECFSRARSLPLGSAGSALPH
jgi:tetratricopeptide (TPR) repeat protein